MNTMTMTEVACDNFTIYPLGINSNLIKKTLCILMAFSIGLFFSGTLLACVDADTTAKDLLAKNNYAKAAIVAAAAAAAALLLPPPAGEAVYLALMALSAGALVESGAALKRYNFDFAHQCCTK